MTWDDICSKINSTYGRDYSGHKYKYDFFLEALKYVGVRPVDYLEIGSFEGVSLVVVGSILRAQDRLGHLVSIDPYFSDGYMLYAPPVGQPQRKYMSTPETMRGALNLYQQFELKVDLMHCTSTDGFRDLLCRGQLFDVIFVDGNHDGLWPFCDAAMALQLLRKNGLLCVDDTQWPDVAPVAAVLERYLRPVHRTGNQIAFSFDEITNARAKGTHIPGKISVVIGSLKRSPLAGIARRIVRR